MPWLGGAVITILGLILIKQKSWSLGAQTILKNCKNFKSPLVQHRYKQSRRTNTWK